MERKILKISMAAVLLLSMLILSRKTADYVAVNGKHLVMQQNSSEDITEDKKICVVIDPGHGGIDPGKIGINKACEKDLNLEIAKKVRKYLELNDISVIMTRESDIGLYRETDHNKKVQDMKNRVNLIDQAGAVLAVSIHQNSYQEEYVAGAQVFFYENSSEGEELAKIMQKQMVNILDRKNTRAAKANDSYYLLKKTETPIIIAECGFLSNKAEAEKLVSEKYQERVAWAIHLAVLEYLNTRQT